METDEYLKILASAVCWHFGGKDRTSPVERGICTSLTLTVNAAKNAMDWFDPSGKTVGFRWTNGDIVVFVGDDVASDMFIVEFD